MIKAYQRLACLAFTVVAATAMGANAYGRALGVR